MYPIVYGQTAIQIHTLEPLMPGGIESMGTIQQYSGPSHATKALISAKHSFGMTELHDWKQSYYFNIKTISMIQKPIKDFSKLTEDKHPEWKNWSDLAFL